MKNKSIDLLRGNGKIRIVYMCGCCESVEDGGIVYECDWVVECVFWKEVCCKF